MVITRIPVMAIAPTAPHAAPRSTSPAREARFIPCGAGAGLISTSIRACYPVRGLRPRGPRSLVVPQEVRRRCVSTSPRCATDDDGSGIAASRGYGGDQHRPPTPGRLNRVHPDLGGVGRWLKPSAVRKRWNESLASRPQPVRRSAFRASSPSSSWVSGDPGGGTHGLPSCSDPSARAGTHRVSARGRSSTTSRRVLPAGSPSRSTGWGRSQSTSTRRARNSSSGGPACRCCSG